MGYWSDPNTVVITNVIGPGPNAKHTRYSFHPDIEYHDSEIDRIYMHSGRICTYLGDWHTHPHGGIGTSQKDRKTLHVIASCHEARTPSPLMAILAVNKEWRLAIWSWQGKDLFWWAKVSQTAIKHFDLVS